nr:hypothetical protein [Tanacetum cinerariifolium]
MSKFFNRYVALSNHRGLAGAGKTTLLLALSGKHFLIRILWFGLQERKSSHKMRMDMLLESGCIKSPVPVPVPASCCNALLQSQSIPSDFTMSTRNQEIDKAIKDHDKAISDIQEWMWRHGYTVVNTFYDRRNTRNDETALCCNTPGRGRDPMASGLYENPWGNSGRTFMDGLRRGRDPMASGLYENPWGNSGRTFMDGLRESYLNSFFQCYV